MRYPILFLVILSGLLVTTGAGAFEVGAVTLAVSHRVFQQ